MLRSPQLPPEGIWGKVNVRWVQRWGASQLDKAASGGSRWISREIEGEEPDPLGTRRVVGWPLAVVSHACGSRWRIWAEERPAVPCELPELAWLLHFELMEGFPGQKQGNWLGGSIDKPSERWWGLGPKWNKDVVRKSIWGYIFRIELTGNADELVTGNIIIFHRCHNKLLQI